MRYGHLLCHSEIDLSVWILPFTSSLYFCLAVQTVLTIMDGVRRTERATVTGMKDHSIQLEKLDCFQRAQVSTLFYRQAKVNFYINAAFIA